MFSQIGGVLLSTTFHFLPFMTTSYNDVVTSNPSFGFPKLPVSTGPQPASPRMLTFDFAYNKLPSLTACRASVRIALLRLHCADTMELLYGSRSRFLRSTKDSNFP
jgi:hypothetical protein